MLNNIENLYKIFSYLTVLCGFLTLLISGTYGLLISVGFILTLVVAWNIENSKFQLSEKLGTLLIVLALPIYYVLWKLKLLTLLSGDIAIAGVLSRLILSLTAIKLLQKKNDRDWIFLYLMSFFEVLLGAGLSISAIYLFTFVFYLISITCSIILFEVRKTADKFQSNENKSLVKKNDKFLSSISVKVINRLPLTALSLIGLILVLALPLFFILPRVGGAGLGSSQESISTSTGFSDSVSLGEIGRIQQNEQIVMRVRIERPGNVLNQIKWRGVALDTFDNKTWKRSRVIYKETLQKDDTGFFRIPVSSGRTNLVVQTVYLEPIDSPVLFSLSRPAVIQGSFPVLFKDSENALTFPRVSYERLSYKVLSDTTLPDFQLLRTDDQSYSEKDTRYLQLPENLDTRINDFAKQITKKSNNRYDKAKSIEQYLQTNFGYTLELKAGGSQPLADFLFNIREGHCEYFATAMAIMLRTQGIATRIVNGFQQGEYNQTADVFVVKQRNAHSWVEVYFPREDVWVPFDPTPFAGQNLETNASTGIIGKFNNYLEALETFWIQYFVAFDSQEQRTLVRSLKTGFSDFQTQSSSWLSDQQEKLKDWWHDVRGDQGMAASAKAVGYGVGYMLIFAFGVFLILVIYRKIRRLKIWRNLSVWINGENDAAIIEFYQRMQNALASKGFVRAAHQTPLEFASALKIPEVFSITEKYNRVRFGEKDLSRDEAQQIENWIEKLERDDSK